MIGQTVSHYKILEKLGEGGMGVVYKAQDTKLDREVALKFLPHHAASTETDRARFLQEARAAAILNHVNVCTIYDIQESGDQQFIVMEYIDGCTLKERILKSRLKMTKAIEYAVQIGEALEEAHSKGIVHRDVKSENIMINGKDLVKVMDFGLAKLRGSVRLTKSSSTTGTLAYMAPEQIQGLDVDGRADIFSFGVVLYEMLAGNTPFRGDHEASMMYSIVNEEPQPIQKYRDDVSSELLHILSRALEKNPEERYQSIKEMLIDLRRLKKDTTNRVDRSAMTSAHDSDRQQSKSVSPATGASRSHWVLFGSGIALTVLIALAVLFKDTLLFSPRPEKKTIAVLPFENLGPGDKDYFVDGMTDEVTSRLSGLSGLGVIARSSASQYRNSSKSIKAIGEELGIQYVLQGTVRWETVDGQTHVRVNPTLVKVEDGIQIWSQSMESVLSSAFKLQTEIATRVATALDVVLKKTEQESLEATLTDKADAYDYYMQAIHYAESDAAADIKLGIQLLERAIDADPNFAAAFAKMSYLHSNVYWFYYDRSNDRIEMSRAAAERALQLNPLLSESYEAMGWYYYHCRLDYTHALEQFHLALKYRPSNSDVHYGIAAVLRRQGQMTRSVESFNLALEGNPRSSSLVRQLGETLSLQRKYHEACQQYDRALRLTPDDRQLYLNKVETILLWKGDLAEVRRIIEDAERYSKREIDNERLNFLSYTVAMIDGRFDDARKALDQMSADEGFGDQFQYYPRPLLRAQLEMRAGNRRLASVYYDSARVILEKKQKANPEDERLYSTLGLAYAGLGRSEDAVRAGQHAVSLLPVEKEVWRGAYRLIDLATIYTMVGEQDKAIDLLERLMELPSPLSVVWLQKDPEWSILKQNPRFQLLKERYNE